MLRLLGGVASVILSVHLAIVAWVILMAALPGHLGWSLASLVQMVK